MQSLRIINQERYKEQAFNVFQMGGKEGQSFAQFLDELNIGGTPEQYTSEQKQSDIEKVRARLGALYKPAQTFREEVPS